MVALEGNADPGKEGLGGWMGRTGQIQHFPGPSLGWAGGFNMLRIDRRAGVGKAQRACEAQLLRHAKLHMVRRAG